MTRLQIKATAIGISVICLSLSLITSSTWAAKSTQPSTRPFPYYVQGGNKFGTNATLGTNDNYALLFETGNQTRMVLNTKGNVGIGTQKPQQKLDISGALRLSAGGDNYTDFSTGGDGNLLIAPRHKMLLDGDMELINHGSIFTTGRDLSLAAIGGDIVFSENKVGIGLTDPTEALDVNGSAQIAQDLILGSDSGKATLSLMQTSHLLQFDVNSDDTAEVKIGPDDVYLGYPGKAIAQSLNVQSENRATLNLLPGSGSAEIYFYDGPNPQWALARGTDDKFYLASMTSGAYHSLSFDANLNMNLDGTLTVKGTGDSSIAGKLGIGTTNMLNNNLMVGDAARAHYIGINSNGFEGIRFMIDSSQKWIAGTDANQSFHITQGAAPPGVTPLGISIMANGKTGIGTNSPKAKLQVAEGDIYLSQPASGIIMKSANGSCFRTTVNDQGALVTQSISCP